MTPPGVLGSECPYKYKVCIEPSIRATFQNFLKLHDISYNEQTREITVGGSTIGDPDSYYDTAVFPILLQAWEAKKYGRPPLSALDNGTNTFLQSLKAAARQNPFHPVEQFLTQLPNVDPGYIAEFCGLMGLEPNSFQATLVTKWLVAAVHRALNPGAQVDTMLVIHGKKGIGKSRTIRFLSNPTNENWYYQVGSGNSKDETMACHKSWISNYDELAFLKSEKNRNELKEWLTKTADTFRAPFERKPEDFPRRFVFCGTTNDLEFLSSDPALQRRFFAITATSMPSEKWLKEKVVKLWAEVKQLHDSGYQHWLTPEEETQHEIHMAKYTGVDLQEDLVLQIIKYLGYHYVAVPQTELSKICTKYDKALENRVKRGQAIQRAMGQLGAPENYKAQPRINGERVPVYKLPRSVEPGQFSPFRKIWDSRQDRFENIDEIADICPILYGSDEFLLKFHENKP
jgi:predicted P-loop ATPase